MDLILTVSGLSVFFLIVKHGVFKIQASSCIPPESVKITFAYFWRAIKSKYPQGLIICNLLRLRILNTGPHLMNWVARGLKT